MKKTIIAQVMLAVFTLLVVLSGCSKDSATPNINGETVYPAKGRIQLPAGSSLAMSDLTVLSCLSSVAPATDGGFSVDEPDTGPALVTVQDKQGHLILMGFVDGADDTIAEISAKSTAAAILFQQLCVYSLLPANWKEALAVIMADANTAALADVIALRLAADPAVFETEDAQIRAAVVAAAEAMLPVSMRSPSSQKLTGRLATGVASTLASSDAASILVTSAPLQSGIQVGANPDGDGIILTNNYRRHAWYWVYVTGYQNADGQDIPYDMSEWVDVTNGYLSATNGLAGALGASLDAWYGNVAYQPVNSPTIDVSFTPSDAKKMYLTVVTASYGRNSQTLPGAIAGDAAKENAWYAGHEGMLGIGLVKDFLFPAIFTFVPANALGRLTGKQLTDLSWDLIGACTQAGFDATTALATLDWNGASWAIIKGVATDEQLREKVAALIATRVLSNYSQKTSGLIAGSAKLAMKALKVIDYAYLGIDYVAIERDCAKSDTYNYFTVTASKPVVRIEPNPATVRPGESVDLTTYKDVNTAGAYEYIYTTTATQVGYLNTPGTYRVTGENPTVTFYCNPGATAGDTATVNVEVKRFLTTNSGTSQVTIGKASVTIKVEEGQVYDAAADFSLAENPNGAWSYGQSASVGGQIALYSTNMVDSLGLSVWYGSTDNYTPSVAKNTTGQAINNATHSITWPAGALSFHPSRYNQQSVVRWTAPEDGTCAIEASFTLLDAQANNVDVHILHNGSSLMNTVISGYLGSTSFSTENPIDVQAGDTIDFAVGYGSNSFLNDTTQLEAKITFTGE